MIFLLEGVADVHEALDETDKVSVSSELPSAWKQTIALQGHPQELNGSQFAVGCSVRTNFHAVVRFLIFAWHHLKAIKIRERIVEASSAIQGPQHVRCGSVNPPDKVHHRPAHQIPPPSPPPLIPAPPCLHKMLTGDAMVRLAELLDRSDRFQAAADQFQRAIDLLETLKRARPTAALQKRVKALQRALQRAQKEAVKGVTGKGRTAPGRLTTPV